MKRIAVVTGSRAEYGIVRPLLRHIMSDNDMELSLMVTGLHLLREYGSTIEDIKKDKIPIESVIEMYDESEDVRFYYGSALGRAIKGFTLEITRINPDIVVVLGDRLEPLAATLSAALLKTPIAHIHGGDQTQSGLIDNSIRHSITRFANIHFVAIDEHKERLLKMGEEPWRIHVVGSMGLDTIMERDSVSLAEISKRIGFDLDNQSILVLFHPTVNENEGGRQMREITKALRKLKMKTIILYPNNDPGNQEIITEIEKLSGLSYIKIIRSLPHDDFVDLMKHVAVMVGNSSSGIIEAASVKLPAVNIGSRQESRSRSENIINVIPKTEDILRAIETALHNEEFRKTLRKVKNPYGDGRTSIRVLDILRKTRVDSALLKKAITY
jgi:GDP/UDP-N,N'-diacetylbacillosamine 2-epimerase (hydrolysing)